MSKQIDDGPCVVNKFATEDEAVLAAQTWSRKDRSEWTVIHAPSETGLAFFVEPGDGGMIRSTERAVGTWKNGRSRP